MGTIQTKTVDNIIYSHLSGELDAAMAKEWVDKLEEQELNSELTLMRYHDVRDVNAVHLSFDDLWIIAQRRLNYYKSGDANKSAFLVNTPLNYGISRMYQALTDGTPFIIEVFYSIEESAKFLNVDKKTLENVTF